MAEVIRMPRMSDTMEEGVIVSWNKKKGDTVSIGEVLAEVETDKATMDLESPEEGVLLHVGVKKGESVAINAIIAILGEKGEDIDALLKEEKKETQTEEKKESPEVKETEAQVQEEKVEVTQKVQETVLEGQNGASDDRLKVEPVSKEDGS